MRVVVLVVALVALVPHALARPLDVVGARYGVDTEELVGLAQNDQASEECSFHGVVVDNVCQCTAGWSGVVCDEPVSDFADVLQSPHGIERPREAVWSAGFSAGVAEKERMLNQTTPTTSLPCVNGCSGHGSCVDGNCHCEAGYALPDCAEWSQERFRFEEGVKSGFTYGVEDASGDESHPDDRLCLGHIELVLRNLIADHELGVKPENNEVKTVKYAEVLPLLTAFQRLGMHFGSIRAAFDAAVGEGMEEKLVLAMIDAVCNQTQLRGLEEDANAFGVAMETGQLARGNTSTVLPACSRLGPTSGSETPYVTPDMYFGAESQEDAPLALLQTAVRSVDGAHIGPVECSSKVYDALWEETPSGRFLSFRDFAQRLMDQGVDRFVVSLLMQEYACPMNCSGVGVCHIDGVCVCPEGYHGAGCEYSINLVCPTTDGQVCSGHGECDKSAGACFCEAGYDGHDCSKETSQCIPECVAPFVCVKTERVAVCIAPPTCPADCSGHGVCRETNPSNPALNTAWCDCDDGWTSVDCSVPLGPGCPLNCSRHGTCMDDDTCLCYPGFYGRACEHRAPSNNTLAPSLFCDDPCNNQGYCYNHTCHCADGWHGVACESKACPYDCTGRGTCDGRGNCQCLAGWGGPDCSLNLTCIDMDCSGHGQCINGICKCDSGWTGIVCSYPQCHNNCSFPQGTCLAPAQCVCVPGFTQVDCSFKTCEAECSHHGRCTNQRSSPLPSPPMATCECDEGWVGAICDTPYKPCPHDCSNNGACEHTTGVCTCHAGWAGDGCERVHIECFPPDCSAHGTCDFSKGECVCEEHYHEFDCSRYDPPEVPPTEIVSSLQCARHGLYNDEAGACECLSGYEGAHCERIQSLCPLGCSGRGICDPNTATCVCEGEASGPGCESVPGTPPPTAASSSAPGPDGVAPSAVLPVELLSCCNNCSGRGLCRNGFCACERGFGGACCNVVYPECPNNCSGAGRCELKRWESGSQCVCNDGNEDPACAGSPGSDGGCPYQCSGHGVCKDGKCECIPEHGMIGHYCNVPLRCKSDCGVNEGRGTCLSAMCVCSPEWTGPDCSVPINDLASACPGSCSGRGQCKFSDEAGGGGRFYCMCDAGLGGDDCSTPTCPNDCSFHGKCNAGACDCEEGWGEVDCSKPLVLCPGHPKHPMYPGALSCSGHGQCSAGTCICQQGVYECVDGACTTKTQGYTGYACQFMTCANNCFDLIGYRTPNVGGNEDEASHGVCDVTKGTCMCERHFKGDDCSIPLNLWEPMLYSNPVKPFGRARFAAVQRNDKIVIHGGYTYRTCPVQRQYPCDYQLGDMWEFDFNMQTWSPIKYRQAYDDLPRERAGHAMVTVGIEQHLVMFGGESNDQRSMKNEVHKDTWLYNFRSGLWHRFPIREPAAIARAHHAMVSRRYSVLVAFGDGFDGLKSDAWEFDLKKELWQRLDFEGQSIPAPRSRPAYALRGDHLIIFGGMDVAGRGLADLYMAQWSCDLGNPLRWQYVSTNSVPPPRWGGAMSWRLGSVYLFGGETHGAPSSGSYKSDLWVYKFAAKDWKRIRTWYWSATGSPVGREDSFISYRKAESPYQDDRLYLFGGHYYARHKSSHERNYLSDMWTYKLMTKNPGEDDPCSDCEGNSFRMCTQELGEKHASLQFLIDPAERSVDDSYAKLAPLVDDDFDQ